MMLLGDPEVKNFSSFCQIQMWTELSYWASGFVIEIEKLIVSHNGENIPLTVSIGIVTAYNYDVEYEDYLKMMKRFIRLKIQAETRFA